MAVRKLQVFIASRFDEFHELRVGLKERLPSNLKSHRLKL